MKNAIILGATAGVGRAIAEELACNDYAVLGFHRGNNNVTTFPGMLWLQDAGSNKACVDAAIEKIKHRAPFDVVVHSLSGASLGRAIDAKPQQIERTFNSLAHSFLWWVQELYQGELLAKSARIIALSNPLQDQQLRQCSLVAAAKAALKQYVRYLAHELGLSGIRVNCVEFGTVMTPALEKVAGAMTAEQWERFQKAHSRLIPAGRMQTAEEVAKFVSVLVRDECEFFNGAVIDFTGGVTQRALDIVWNG